MKRTLPAILFLLAMNLGIIGVSWVFRQTVAPGWKKGPLIDPASPYAPENAMVLFAFAACLALDVYILVLAVWRRRGRSALAPWVALALAGLVSEGGVRAWLALDMVTYFRPHPTLHWVVRPNLDGFDNLKGGGRISTNADGMREVTAPREKPAGQKRVLVLGDSSNFGHGVEGNEVWSSVLHDLVPELTVLNGATPGWTTFQAVEFLRETGLAYHPDVVIAGFNNDPGPEYLADTARVPRPVIQTVNRVLFRFETYLLSREVLLSMLRHANARYTARSAGSEPLYGKLSEEESAGLVPRVPLEAFLKNLRTLDGLSPEFVWINMPINRMDPELVERYVNFEYRTAAEKLSTELGFSIVDVDARWQRTNEADLFQAGHVFHPNATGHRRLAEQVAQEIFRAEQPNGRTFADSTLRFGISSLTPVHAHVLAVLQAMPELAARHGLTIALTGYKSGKTQGEDVAKGALDAFFTCEVPAVQMMEGREVRAVAAPGVLGRIAVVTRKGTLQDLRGRKVGLVAGSTPAMDWQTWGAGLDATVVELDTDGLFDAVESGAVDAVVGWDPWVEDWLAKDPTLRVVAEREFRSVLAVSVPWSTGGSERAQAFVALVEEAARIAAADRPRWDAAVAELSGWPLEVVRAVADRNAILSGRGGSLTWSVADSEGLERAARFATQGRIHASGLVGLELLEGLSSRGKDVLSGDPPGRPRAGQRGPPGAGGVPGAPPPGPPRPQGG